MQRFNRYYYITAVPIIFSLILISCLHSGTKSKLARLKYNHPGLQVDLGVGLWAWPLPMDFDKDGDYDLVVSCNDKPNNGIYFFENEEGDVKMPVFKAAVRVGPGIDNIQISYVDGQVHLLAPAQEIMNFRQSGFMQRLQIYATEKIHQGKVRANQWKYCDFEKDDDMDLIVGIQDGEDYGWDNAFNSFGQWVNGPLHGFVYLLKNVGSTGQAQYAEPVKIEAAGKPIDVYGMPTPNLADFDGDGDLDLLCGEFLDKFTYFENIGSRQVPQYTNGKYLTYNGQPLTMDLEMIVPVALDWDKDGDIDLMVGQEDGRVAWLENTGKLENSIPQFLPPQFFQQVANEVKFGALVTPYSFDWDGDSDEDLICGNTAGYIGFIENLNGGNPPRWAAPKYLEANGQVIRIQAGYNGSIQGPCEAKWGYTTLNVADWDHDGLPDIVINSIWGIVEWFKNIGSRTKPELASAQLVEVEWPGAPPKPAWTWWKPREKTLATQWRTTPVVIDLNKDGLNDLVMLDHEGFLSFFERKRMGSELKLLPGKRIFRMKGESVFNSRHEPQNSRSGLLQLNNGFAGKSGRRKLCFADWNRDGKLDALVNGVNVNFLRNVSTGNDTMVFQDMGQVSDSILAGHSTSPTVVDWDKNGVPDLLIGAEDGFLYYLKNDYQAEH